MRVLAVARDPFPGTIDPALAGGHSLPGLWSPAPGGLRPAVRCHQTLGAPGGPVGQLSGFLGARAPAGVPSRCRSGRARGVTPGDPARRCHQRLGLDPLLRYRRTLGSSSEVSVSILDQAGLQSSTGSVLNSTFQRAGISGLAPVPLSRWWILLRPVLRVNPFFGRFVRVIAPVPAGFPDFHRTAAGHHLLFEGPSLGYLTANRFSVRPGMLPPGSLGVNPFFSGSSPRAAFHRRGRYSPALGILPPFPGPRQPLFYGWFPVLGRALACRRGHPLRPPVLLPRRTGRRASRGAPRRFGTTSGLYHWRRYLSTSFFGSLVPGW